MHGVSIGEYVDLLTTYRSKPQIAIALFLISTLQITPR
jgi:hypothetical protein